MDRILTYATVCSGIECMSVACRGLPLRPVFFSEIEPFPCAVLKAHYPDVPNLGDMSKIQVSNNGKEITNGTVRLILERPLDILAGGTPCQDVSVAGKRAGMQEGSGTRSSLAFDFVRLARELGPRFVIWENVAGAIDSKNAPDFLAFLRALGDCGYSLAWRVLDAQYVRVDSMERGLPQRRRRVWVVGYSGADESRAAKILFEPDCVAGHTAPRRRTGEGFAYFAPRRDRVDAPVVGEPRIYAVRTANTHANGHGVAEGATHTLDGANGQGVAYKAKRTWWNGAEVATTTTTTGHNQLMPDKDRFDAVVECRDVAETIDSNYFKGQGSRQGVERPVAVQRYDVSTNSNGEDVAPTVNANMSKLGGDNQTTFGGGYVVSRRGDRA